MGPFFIYAIGGAAALLGTWLAYSRQARHLALLHSEIESLHTNMRGVYDSHLENTQQQAASLKWALDEQKQREFLRVNTAFEQRRADLEKRRAHVSWRQNDAKSRENSAGEKAASLTKDEQRVTQRHSQVKQLRQEHAGALETQARTTRRELVKQRVRETRETANWRAQRFHAEHRDVAESTAFAMARKVMGTTMERISVSGHLERIQNLITFSNPRTYEAFANKDDPAREILLEQIDFRLEESQTEGALLVRGDDPLGREIARRVLRQISNKSISAPAKVRAICKRVHQEISRESQNAAKKAFKQLGLRNAHPDVMALVGRLKFRLSYSQNQLKHAVEVAYLSGMLAQEMGLDVDLARRGGLLHDIGKAMTHEREGSHAVLGAEVARRCREHEIVSNAIGSHHNDEPMNTPYAFLVTAADAISGARPGARRETITLYLDRVRQIQDIAYRHPQVERVDVMHAGREIRLVVPGREVTPDTQNKKQHAYVPDEELHPLAEEVARDLEEELTFPGQIRVTVIRNSTAIAIAR